MDDKSKVRVHFIRHGETLWSLSGQHTGQTDLPLTAAGEIQASAAGHKLKDIQFDRVFTSPLQRAQQSCVLAGLDRSSELDRDLSEWDYGDFEGRTSLDIGREHPGWNLFKDGCPNGESPGEVTSRVDRVIVLLRAMTGNVALFSHGQFGASLAARWIGLPILDAQHFPLDAASISVLGYETHHPEIPAIILWNETTRF